MSPNPLVGAVLVRDDIVVGEGYHAAFGGEHAEVAALSQAGDTALRLERIEQAIEAMAVEVERISEGQRFVTKLLAERNSSPAAAIPAAGERRS